MSEKDPRAPDLSSASLVNTAFQTGSGDQPRLLIFLGVCLVFAFGHDGAAATIPVTNLSNSGTGSLRQAITTANANADADIIRITVTGIINLASLLPSLQHQLEIVGPGATSLTVRRDSTTPFRIFTIASGAKVKISDITIRDGRTNNNLVGGGIQNSGNLTLLRCEVRSNATVGDDNPNGGGGAAYGGGIYNSGIGTLKIDHCTIAENDAIGGSGNMAIGGGGTGVGGGIYNAGAVTIIASTLSGNDAMGGLGAVMGASAGGGLYLLNSPTGILRGCTVSNNTAQTGGGLFVSNADCRIRNTILAGNSATTGPECDGSITSENHNLIQNPSGCSVNDEGQDIFNQDPNLGMLQDNGGPTRTHTFVTASPAMDAGDNAILNPLLNITTDQRLRTRKSGFAVDIGALEGGGEEVAPEDFNGDENPDFALFRSADHKTALWYLDGNAFADSAYGPTLPAGWELVDTGDFNKDAQSDYLLFNNSTKQTSVWFLANASLIGATYGPKVPAGWRLVGTAHFNMASLDYLLVNPATRETAIWYLDGTIYAAAAYGPTLPAGWTLVGAANFGGATPRDDYLLYNATTRETAIWFLDGYAYDHGAYGPTAPSGWQVVGVADINGDGKPDLALSNPSTRQTSIWYLNGTSFVNGAYGPTLPSGWQLNSP